MSDHCSYLRGILFALSTLLLTSQPALSTTFFVDGACSSSGSGTTLTCGANGPFKTISEGVTVLQPGDTLDIRGAHDAFGGVYNEYVGIWGTTTDSAPGKALNCTAGSPCVVQGCPAAVCGADETPTITGLVRRTDWTDESNGIWSRLMESDTAEYIYEAPRDAFDPTQILQGANPKVNLQYAGDNVSAPTEGHWSYNTGTHRVYINPTGTGNPNNDTLIWVPNLRGLLTIQGDVNSCPSAPNCPPTNYVTLRRLTFEGSRWMGMLVYPAPDGASLGQNLVLDTIVVRYIPRFSLNSYRTANFTLSNVTTEYGCRGIDYIPANGGGCFGLRLAHVSGGTFSNVTTRHLGSAGSGGLGIDCQWCDAPWNAKAGNALSANGVGFDLKQSNNVVVTKYSSQDISYFAFQFDVSHDVTLDGFTLNGARYGTLVREFTPDVSAGFTRNYNNIIRNGTLDNIGFNDGGAIFVAPISSLNAGEFGVKIYNNFITRPSYAGISVNSGDQVSIWNNSIYGTSTYGWAPDGIKILSAVTNLDVRNNIVANVTGSSLAVATAAIGQNPTFDFDLFYDAGQRKCAATWGTTCDINGGCSGGTCYASMSALRTATGEEAHGLEGNPQFVSTATVPPDLHIQASSAAKDVGATLNAFPDIDGQTRPSGPAWDIGADEYWPIVQGTPPAAPTLLQVVPLNAP